MSEPPRGDFDFGGSLEPGVLVPVAPGVRRLVAPNASTFTGPGTNSYVLGEPPRALLDPGPADPAHLARLREAVPVLEAIFVTHTHPDHSPAVAQLAAATGARVIGRRPPRHGPQDATFAPDREPARDERFTLPDGAQLRAIDTPGHASNHVCWLLEGCGLLFSGDHLLEGVTPVIMPPDGDMSDYLESLARLKRYPLSAIAPGHGRLIPDPLRVIDGVVAHRARREAKVTAALAAARAATVEELIARVYDDVPQALHRIARHSLEAHLIKLEREGRASRVADRWHAA